MIVDGKEYSIKDVDYDFGGYQNKNIVAKLTLVPSNGKGKGHTIEILDAEWINIDKKAP
jgi:hypothetical protein